MDHVAMDESLNPRSVLGEINSEKLLGLARWD